MRPCFFEYSTEDVRLFTEVKMRSYFLAMAAASAFGLLATPAQAGCHRHKHQHAEWYEREWNNDEYQPQQYDQSQRYYQSQPYYQQTECYRPIYYYPAPVCEFDEECEDD